MTEKKAIYHDCGMRNDIYVVFREWKNSRTFAASK